MGQRSRKSVARAEQDRIRQVLAEAREAAGLSQRDLSAKLGESHPYIWNIERGERTIDVVEFIDIAYALSIDPVALFTRVVPSSARILPAMPDINQTAFKTVQEATREPEEAPAEEETKPEEKKSP